MAKIAEGLPWSLLEWRGWEIDHFLLAEKGRKHWHVMQRNRPALWLESLSRSVPCPQFYGVWWAWATHWDWWDWCITYACTSEPSLPSLRFDVIYFLMFLRMKAKFIFSHISSPGSLEMAWRGTDGRSLPRLKWHSGQGPLLCPFSLRVPGVLMDS